MSQDQFTVVWGDFPVRPDSATDVPDDHSDAFRSDRDSGRFSDPTFEIEAVQKKALAGALSGMADFDEALVYELPVNGGGIHDEELADRAGIGISTFSDVLNRIPELVKLDRDACRELRPDPRATRRSRPSRSDPGGAR